MKKICLSIFVALLSFSTFAQKRYIDTQAKVTFRSGPGTDNKIVKMLEEGDRVELEEAGQEWSRVKIDGETTGYVMNRFLSEEVPYKDKFLWVNNKFKDLQEKNKENLDELQSTKAVLKEKNLELEKTLASLTKLQEDHEQLKIGSSDYLGLKEKFELGQARISSQGQRVLALEAKLFNHNLIWFLSGAGVLLLGWLIGLVTRKRKTAGSSLRF